MCAGGGGDPAWFKASQDNSLALLYSASSSSSFAGRPTLKFGRSYKLSKRILHDSVKCNDPRPQHC